MSKLNTAVKVLAMVGGATIIGSVSFAVGLGVGSFTTYTGLIKADKEKLDKSMDVDDEAVSDEEAFVEKARTAVGQFIIEKNNLHEDQVKFEELEIVKFGSNDFGDWALLRDHYHGSRFYRVSKRYGSDVLTVTDHGQDCPQL